MQTVTASYARKQGVKAAAAEYLCESLVDARGAEENWVYVEPITWSKHASLLQMAAWFCRSRVWNRIRSNLDWHGALHSGECASDQWDHLISNNATVSTDLTHHHLAETSCALVVGFASAFYWLAILWRNCLRFNYVGRTWDVIDIQINGEAFMDHRHACRVSR